MVRRAVLTVRIPMPRIDCKNVERRKRWLVGDHSNRKILVTIQAPRGVGYLILKYAAEGAEDAAALLAQSCEVGSNDGEGVGAGDGAEAAGGALRQLSRQAPITGVGH